MKIGFDARMITHPGIGRYIKCLLPELTRQASNDEFTLFGSREALEEFRSAQNVNIQEWTAPIYSIQEQLFPANAFSKLDVLHVPHFNVPVFFKGKMVVTIHDLIYLLFPSSLPHPAAKHYAAFMMKKALKNSERIISVSANTKNDLIGLFGEKYSGKIDVIYEAPGELFRKVEDKTKIADLRCRHRLEEKIILYVGSIKPHKNVETLIKAFDILKAWGAPHQLVICGKWDKKEDRLKNKIVDRNIRYLGEVPNTDLAVLYSMADVLVHLSFYEGFGLTVLEAMRCGTPVVASNSSSLPEVSGEAAYSVSPHDVEKIADTIYNVLINKRLREGMIEAGYEHAMKFSWEKAARETLAVYRNVAEC